MSRYSDDRVERQRVASLPMLRFQLDSMEQYIAGIRASLDPEVLNWEQSVRDSIDLHNDVDEFQNLLKDVVPETINHKIGREMAARHMGISEDALVTIESGEDLAKLVTDGILKPADAQHIIDEAAEKGINLSPPEDGWPGTVEL